MHRIQITIFALFATAGNCATADSLQYELEVSGMVCAFCAYNVSRQLKTLDGVDAQSIEIVTQ